jgi:hypothetical protein
MDADKWIAVLKLVVTIGIVTVIGILAYKVITKVMSVVQHDCGDNSTWNDDRSRCESDCKGEGQKYDVNINGCGCDEDYILSPDGLSCTAAVCNIPPNARCPSDSKTGQCYNPNTSKCMTNNSVCPDEQYIKARTVQAAGKLNSNGINFQTPSPLQFENLSKVTINPPLKIQAKEEPANTVYYIDISSTSATGPSLYTLLSEAKSGASPITFDASSDTYTVFGTISDGCCPPGQHYDPKITTGVPCSSICPKGADICPHAPGGCCTLDNPVCGKNKCCAKDGLDTNNYCCDTPLCNGECCQTHECCGSTKDGCNTDGSASGNDMCLTSCKNANGASTVCPRDHICQEVYSDGKISGGCASSALDACWLAQPVHLPHQINLRNDGTKVGNICSDSEGVNHYCVADNESAGDLSYSITYTFDTTNPDCEKIIDTVTDADCAAKAGNVDVTNTTWDPVTKTCVATAKCKDLVTGESELPICVTPTTGTIDTICPLNQQTDDVGMCCKLENNVGTIVYAKGGVRPSDSPMCEVCSGHGDWSSTTSKCTCTNTSQNWLTTPYSGDYCDLVDAKCTNWQGVAGSAPQGSCPLKFNNAITDQIYKGHLSGFTNTDEFIGSKCSKPNKKAISDCTNCKYNETLGCVTTIDITNPQFKLAYEAQAQAKNMTCDLGDGVINVCVTNPPVAGSANT